MAEIELIDRKALLKYVRGIGNHFYSEWDTGGVLVAIEKQPTIEAKPVVYCKDCKYNVANRQQDPLDITDYTDIVCDYFMTDGMEADDFCSKGVKIPVISMEDVPKLAKEMEK